jgi:diguanylate cyclase (GGDEF)-like protein
MDLAGDTEHAHLRQLLKAAQERIALLEALVDHDPLCSILNRRGFERALSGAMERFARYGENTVLVYLDLDGFKAVNDLKGHQAGDRLLKDFAHFLRTHCRMTDTCGRLGGDEFALLMPHASLEDTTLKITEWRESLRETLSLSFSAGVILLREESLREAIARADAAMYRDKNARRLTGTPILKHISRITREKSAIEKSL